MRRIIAVTAALAALLVIGGCDAASNRAGVRLDVNGQVEVVEPGHRVKNVTRGATLTAGQRVRVVRGTATVHLSSDAQLELRTGSELEMKPGINGSGLRPVLQAGDLLVKAGRQRVTVDAMSTAVRVLGGSVHLSRGLTLLVATYSGSADVESAGRAITVPALRQVVVAAVGLLPAHPSPLEPSTGDSWDLRFLGDAIELGNQLNARSRGFTGQVRAEQSRSPDFFRQLFPRLQGESLFGTLFDPDRSPGETLVGAAIVLEAGDSSFQDRWMAVFGFRDEGASWGLVARELGVAGRPLLEALDAAIGRTVTVVPPSTIPPPTTPSVTPTTRPVNPTRRGTTTTTTTTAPAPGSTVPPMAGPGGGPLNTNTPLDTTVNSLVDTLSGLLKGLGR